MKLHSLGKNLTAAGLFCFLVVISITNLSTNLLSQLFIVPVRQLTAAAVIAALGILLLSRKVTHKELTAAGIYLSLLAYGLALSLINDSYDIGVERLPINVLITLSGIVLIAKQRNAILSDRISWYFLLYVLLGLCLTIAVGGLELDFPPQFFFEYASARSTTDILYTHGISQFFGCGALAAAFMLTKSNSKARSLFLGFCIILLLALSLLGGARGDSFASVVLTLGYLALQFRTRFFLSLFPAGTALVIYVDNWSVVENFHIFRRMSAVLTGDYSLRDQLLGLTSNLISLEPDCLIVGCGFGYFQHFYGFEFGLYPHNLFAESIIVFGLPITVILGAAVVGGIRDYYHSVRNVDFFLLFFALYFVVAMKSGGLFGGWFVTASSMYFASLFLTKRIGSRVT